MSYLNNYRLNFWGGIYTNVCTANNDDVGCYYVDPVKAMLSPNLRELSDDNAINVLKKNPGWNLYGDYVTTFKNAKISSFGEPANIKDTGDIIGQGVYLLGSLDPKNSSPNPIGSPIMVDMDSTGTSCTQIIVGGLQIGGTTNPLLRINENTRCYTRSLQKVNDQGQGGFQMKSVNAESFGKANTSWQLSFEYSDDWKYDASNTEIATLVEKAKAAKGITIVFTQFEVMLAYSRQKIKKEYADGKGTINPVLGYTIGTIGVWEEDESRTCLPGRLLSGQNIFPKDWQDRIDEPEFPLSFCDTYAQLDESSGIMTINMASTFNKPKPRKSREDLSTMSPTTNPGTIALVVDHAGTKEIVAPIPYNHENYYLYGGLVDIKLTQQQITQVKSGDIMIAQVNGNTIGRVYSLEERYRFISDDRGIYLDPHEAKNLEFNITKWGQPITEDLDLNIVFSDSGQLAESFYQYTEMNAGFSDANGTAITFKDLSHSQHTYIGTTTVKAADAAKFKLNVDWKQPGMKQVSLIVNGASRANYYMVIRTYCDDDYSNVPDETKYTWAYVYENVLRYYYVVFPAMSTHIPLNDRVTISRNVNQLVAERISDEYKDTTLLMPITRDMSPGKIQLLTEYLAKEKEKESQN